MIEQVKSTNKENSIVVMAREVEPRIIKAIMNTVAKYAYAVDVNSGVRITQKQ
ncbi:hypothetical protein [Maribacter polysiphoniae]|uniref:hypothetical protein n=1 Tax=Maribacter polysiphoniae TaxID=429344 RepID=UPI002353BA0D|nr:hypothetical protein [Maribacter polysiphoniae]